MRAWRSVSASVLVVGLALSGCSSVPEASVVTTPKGTVLVYYLAVNAHDWSRAASVLSASQQRRFLDGADSDRNNTRTVSHVTVEVRPAPFANRAFSGYEDIQQALVTYDATFTRIESSNDGPQTRFLSLGRAGRSRPWRILSIGSGP